MFGGGGFGGMPFGMFGGIPYMGGGGFGRGRRGRGGFNPWFLMMAIRLWNEIDRLPVKPPVTLGVMALSSALHFGILGDRTFSASDACLNPRAVIELGEWHRLVTKNIPKKFDPAAASSPENITLFSANSTPALPVTHER